MAHEIFISYSHVDKKIADAICCHLEKQTMKCWYAPRDIMPGKDWAESITEAIESSKVFVLILSENSNISAQVLREVNLAVSNRLHIITFKISNLEVNNNLKYFIGTSHWLEAMTAPLEDHIGRLGESVAGFLDIPISIAPSSKRFSVKKLFRNRLFLICFSLVMLGAVIGGSFLYKNQQEKQFFDTAEGKNIAGDVINHVSKNITYYNIMVGAMDKFYLACDNSLISKADDFTIANSVEAVKHSLNNVPIADGVLSSDLYNNITKTTINVADIAELNNLVSTFKRDFLSDIEFIEFLMSDSCVFDDSVKRELMNIYQSSNLYYSKIMLLGANELLIQFDEESLSDFKNKTLPELIYLPEYTWLYDKDEILRQIDVCLNKLNGLEHDSATITGDLSVSVQEYKTNPPELVPLETDEPGMLWAKMIMSADLGLYDQAIQCAQMYHQQMRSEDKNSDIYMPAVIAFISSMADTGIDSGLLVVNFAPEIESHEIYELGDIIVAVNGNRCTSSEAYSELEIKAGDIITVFRRQETGDYQMTDITATGNPSKVYFFTLSSDL